MIEKNKNNTLSQFKKVVTHASLTLMIAATLISMAEVAEREGHRIVATLQPSYAYVGQHDSQFGHGDEQMRRGGREEVRHMSPAYDTLKRSNAVSGTI